MGVENIFVPFIHKGVAELFAVDCRQSLENGFHFSGMKTECESSGAKQITKKLDMLFSEKNDFDIYLESKNGNFLDCSAITDSTQSITLGIICAIFGKINNRKFKKNLSSVTVTGNVEIDGNGEIVLKPVTRIEEKLLASILFAKSRPEENHLFIHVSEEGFDLNDIPENLSVVHINPECNILSVYAEIFEPIFDEEQSKILEKAVVNRNWDFTETDFFRSLKEDARSKKWNGFLLTGEGESGKSRTAFELCKYLMTIGKVYAPAWIYINPQELREKIQADTKNQGEMQDSGNGLAKKNKSKLYEYFLKKINFASGSCGGKNLLYVIDNLEQETLDIVFETIEEIFSDLHIRPFIIFTSRGKKYSPIHEEKLGFVSRQMGDLSIQETEKLILGVAENTPKEFALKDSAAEDFDRLVSFMYNHFSMFPGIIPVALDGLNYSTVPELVDKIKLLDVDGVQGKIEDIYNLALNNRDFTTQMILFAFIFLFCKNERGKTGIDKICRLINEMVFSNREFLSKRMTRKSLDELASANIIIQVDVDKYFIKNLAMVHYIFTDNISNELKNIRNIMLTPMDKAIIAIEYGLIEKLREQLCFIDGEENLTELLFEAAENGNSSEILKLIVEHGADPYARTIYGGGIFEMGVTNPSLEIFDTILEKHWYTDIDEPMSIGSTALLETVGYCKNESEAFYKVKKLIALGANPLKRDRNNLSFLHKACKAKFVGIIRYILENHFYENINETDNYGEIPLQAVAKFADKSLIDIFVQNGADPFFVGQFGRTLLHAVTENPDINVMKYVMENHWYTDIDELDEFGNSPLLTACIYNNADAINLILDNGANPFIKSKNNMTFFIFASGNCEYSVVKKIIDNHWYSDINEANDDGKTPCIAAAENKNFEVLKLILKNGGNPFVQSAEGSILHSVVCSGNVDAVKFVLENKFYENINYQGEEGFTPLMVAVILGSLEIFKLLLQNGADEKIKSSEGYGLLHCCIYAFVFKENGNHFADAFKILRYIIENSLYDDINERDNNGMTPLHFVFNVFIQTDIEDKMDLLLSIFNLLYENGADIFAKDNEGNTILHLASVDNEELNFVLEKKLYSNIDEFNNENQTPLLYSVASVNSLFYDPGCFCDLLENGADPNLVADTLLHWTAATGKVADVVRVLKNNWHNGIDKKDSEGKTPLLYAAYMNDNPEVLERLVQKGANVFMVDDYGTTLLAYAAMNQNTVEMLKTVLENKWYEQIDMVYTDGKTLLMMMAENLNNPEVLELLVEYGANPWLKSEDGTSLLEFAQRNENCPEMAQVVMENGWY